MNEHLFLLISNGWNEESNHLSSTQNEQKPHIKLLMVSHSIKPIKIGSEIYNENLLFGQTCDIHTTSENGTSTIKYISIEYRMQSPNINVY